MTRNLDIAEDAGDFFENHYSSGTFSGTHSGTSTGPISSSATFPAGTIINVQSTTITTALDLGSIASGGEAQVTGLTVAITPKTTSSKMLLMYNVMGSKSGIGGMANLRLKRDSTNICVATSTKSSQLALTAGFDQYTNTSAEYNENTVISSGTFLDSPSTTSEVTYKIFMVNVSTTSRNIYINRTVNDGDLMYNVRGTSTLTVMEIAG